MIIMIMLIMIMQMIIHGKWNYLNILYLTAYSIQP